MPPEVAWRWKLIVTTRGLLYFFFRKKSNKKPRRAKNSLWFWFNCLAFWYAFSPVRVSSAVSFICCALLSLVCAWNRSFAQLGQFSATGWLPIRGDFLWGQVRVRMSSGRPWISLPSIAPGGKQGRGWRRQRRGHSRSSDNLARQVGYLFEMIFSSPPFSG